MNKLSKLKKNFVKKVGLKSTFEDTVKKKFKINKEYQPLKKSSPVKKDPLILERGRDFHHDHKLESELFHGIDLHNNLMPGLANTTKELLVGKNNRGDHVVLKAPLSADDHLFWSGYEPHQLDALRPHSLFANPEFLTSHREAVFKRLADSFFGLGHAVPETTLFKNPKDGKVWSAQKFIKSKEYNKSDLSHLDDTGDLHKLAIMDTILGNQDRNKSNVRVNEGTPVLIDNALSFDYNGLYGSETPAYAEHLLRRPVPKSVHKWISGLDENKLINEASKYNVPEQTKKLMSNRLSEIKRWSSRMAANPHWNQNFGNALEITRMHKFDNPLVDKKLMISEAYRTISRGENIKDSNNKVDQYATTK